MAGYQCGGCDGAEPATILITPLNGAETLAIGDNCMPVTWCGILAGVLGIDPEKLWDAATALKTPPAVIEDRGAAGPPIDKDKCPICKAGVVIPEFGMCQQCVAEHGLLPASKTVTAVEGTGDAATDGKAIRVTPHPPKTTRTRRPRQ